MGRRNLSNGFHYGFSTIDSPHIWSYTPNGNTVKTLTGGYSMGNYDNGGAGGSATQYEVVVLPTIPTDART